MSQTPKTTAGLVQGLLLAFLGFLGWWLWEKREFPIVVWILAGLAGYGLAFWLFLPEIRGQAGDQRQALSRRWAQFAAIVGIPLAIYNGTLVVSALADSAREYDSLWEWTPGIFAAVLLLWLPIEFFAATEASIAASEDGPKAGEPERGFVSWFARFLCRMSRLAGPRAALILGTLFTLLSLGLAMDIGGWKSSVLGYQVLLSEQAWATARHGGAAIGVVYWFWKAGSVFYWLGVALAGLTLLLTVRRSSVGTIAGPRLTGTLVIVAYFLFLHMILDSSLFVLAETERPQEIAAAILLAAYTLLPLVLWLTSQRRRPENASPAWLHTWVGIQIAFLPLGLVALFVLCVGLAFGVHGYVVYFCGIGLLWWGYAQQKMGMPAQAARA